MKFLFIIFKIIAMLCVMKSYKIIYKNDFVMGVNDHFYRIMKYENRSHNFENMIFRQLEEKAINKTDNLLANTSLINYRYVTNTREEMRIYMGDYISKKRTIKFYLSKSEECSVYINDSVSYEKLSNINFVEHMVLHNNGESIEPKGVYSDQVTINFFAFNRKLNIFSVYFENHKDYANFTIEFDYTAKYLLKSVIDVEKNKKISNRIQKNFIKPNNSTNSSLDKKNVSKKNENPHDSKNYFNPNEHHYNWFIWKLLNQNFLKEVELLKIEVYFDLDSEFKKTDVKFSLNFTKSIEVIKKETFVKYSWEGVLFPQQLMILDVKFPLYFESCGNLRLSWMMIIIGSIFIIFLVTMLHLILSTVFFEDF